MAVFLWCFFTWPIGSVAPDINRPFGFICSLAEVCAGEYVC